MRFSTTRILVAVFSVLVGACGGSGSKGTPTAPPSPSAPASGSWSIAGAVSDAVTGLGLPNATLTFQGSPAATTDSNGRWQLEGTGAPPTTVFVTKISAPGYYDRDTRIQWRSGGRSDVALTLFPDRAPFSLDFFRMLIRNSYEEPESLEPLRRWTSNPNVYLNATNPKTKQKLLDSEIEMLEQTLRAVIPQATGGLLTLGEFEVGVTPRAERAGYINIEITYEPGSDNCGTALVGSNPGRIRLNYEACQVSWCRDAISPNVVAHEAGHAMGLWHVPDGMMVPTLEDCRGTTFTQAELLHARLAYQRPAGNRDIDQDPSAFQALTVDTRREVICHNAPARRN
jgi:hypothetical protein